MWPQDKAGEANPTYHLQHGGSNINNKYDTVVVAQEENIGTH